MGLALFLIVIFIMLKVLFSMNIIPEKSPTYTDAVHLSSQLVTAGYPSNWTNSTPDPVIIPGIAEDNRVDANKLLEYNLIGYDRTKMLFHISSDYIFFFSNGTHVINLSQCTYGHPIATDSECNPIFSNFVYSDLSKINRIVVYNNTIMRLTVYAWQ